MNSYGLPPIDLGPLFIDSPEMLCWVYCPIRTPDSCFVIPDNLKQFGPIVRRSWFDYSSECHEMPYVYLTAKTLWVNASNPGNRPGWHSDGFLTEDTNYIWCDRNPTVFWEPTQLAQFTPDHELSLVEMDIAAESDASHHQTYPSQHLLKLNQFVIHKVPVDVSPGVRTFVKVSYSRSIYNLRGNSINHELPTSWNYVGRSCSRNHPIGGNQ